MPAPRIPLIAIIYLFIVVLNNLLNNSKLSIAIIKSPTILIILAINALLSLDTLIIYL